MQLTVATISSLNRNERVAENHSATTSAYVGRRSRPLVFLCAALTTAHRELNLFVRFPTDWGDSDMERAEKIASAR